MLSTGTPVSEVRSAALGRADRFCRAIPQACAAFLAVVSVLVLCGWLFHILILTSLLPGHPSMAVPTAIGFLVSSIALSRYHAFSASASSAPVRPMPFPQTRLLAVLLLLLGVGTLGFFLVTNQADATAAATVLPATVGPPINRTSPNASVNFILIGAALFLIDTPWRPKSNPHTQEAPHPQNPDTAGAPTEPPRWPYQILCLVVILDAFLALLGQLYGVVFLYGVSRAIGIALPTALLFLVLGLGILLSRPERGFIAILLSSNVAGRAARRLLPVVFALPLVLGAITLFGLRTGVSFTTYLAVVASVGLLISLFWGNILMLHQQVERALSYVHQLSNQEIALERQKAEIAQAALQLQQRRFVREMLSSVTEGKLCLCDTHEDQPSPLLPICESVDLTSANLRVLRKRVEAAAAELSLPPERTHDLITAVGEAAMNAVKYGGGGIGRVCADKSMVQVWIEDHGTGIRDEDLHRATLEKGWSGKGSLGHGFYLMLRTVDRTYLLTGAQGTTVVLEQAQTPPEPAWLQAIR